MQTIAIIDDNPVIREAVSSYLQVEDFNTVEFPSCSGVQEFTRNEEVDLMLVDVQLPDGNGFNLVKELRQHSDVPVIFLTSKSEESDRILGFEVGADDYMLKPFSCKELVLRIKAVLKRQGSTAAPEFSAAGQRWQSGDNIINFNMPAHKFQLNDNEVKFTSTEWKIISYLISNAQVVVSREQILDHSLEYHFEGYDRIVDTHIKNIRAKLDSGNWIETVRSYGYSFTGKNCD